MATNLGTAVNFGFVGTDGITIANISGFLLQNVDYQSDGDIEEIRDGDGDLAAEVHYNANTKATLEAVITGGTQASAITNTALKAKGAFVSITACTSVPELIASTWRVMSFRISGSNTTAKRINLELAKHAGVTAAAT